MPLRPTWPLAVATLTLGFLALAGIFRLTHDTGQTANTSHNQTAGSAVPALILDLHAPVRPVVSGSFSYAGPGGPFVQPFLGVFDFESGCESYTKGSAGRFQTPYAVYPRGARIDRSFSGRLTVPAYKGPGPYATAQIEGDFTARDAFGVAIGGTSTGVKATFVLQTRADGSGSLSFTGPDVVSGDTGQTASGVMSWTYQDQRIDLNAYSLSPY